MDLDISGRVAIVSGSSKGLGKATALALAAEGVKLVMSARNEDRLRMAAAEVVEATGAEVLPVAADVSTATGVDALMEATIERFESVDILVPNSGGPKLGSFSELTDDDWEEAFSLVCLSLIRMVRAALPHMERRQWGRIISIQSSSVKQPVDRLTLSNGLRPGVAGLLKTLAVQYADDNITVNTVLPGIFLTDRISDAQRAVATERGITHDEQLAETARLIPMGRFGDPSELGSVVTFLASDAARYVTGGVFQVDGGLIRSVV